MKEAKTPYLTKGEENLPNLFQPDPSGREHNYFRQEPPGSSQQGRLNLPERKRYEI